MDPHVPPAVQTMTQASLSSELSSSSSASRSAARASSRSMSMLTGSSMPGSRSMRSRLRRLSDQRAVREPLPEDLGDEQFDAVGVGHLAGRVPEVELGEVTVQVLVAHGVEGAVDAALQLSEERLGRVGGHLPADVF